jgi:hypothetical protein
MSAVSGERKRCSHLTLLSSAVFGNALVGVFINFALVFVLVFAVF